LIGINNQVVFKHKIKLVDGLRARWVWN